LCIEHHPLVYHWSQAGNQGWHTCLQIGTPYLITSRDLQKS